MAVLAFVGGGHLASAIIGGVIKAGRRAGYLAQDIVVAGRSEESLRRLTSLYGIKPVIGAGNLPEQLEAVVLAVRPADARAVCGEITNTAPLISVVAGLTLAQLKKCAPHSSAYVRAMPNLPVQIGKGMTALFAPDIDDATRKMADALFCAVGKTLWLRDEDMMAAATAISGSGAGYVFYFAESLAAAAREMGFDDETAHLLALQTLCGASSLAMDSKQSPKTLRQNVAVPGGTTEQAIKLMQERDFTGIIRDAAKAAARRARELSD